MLIVVLPIVITLSVILFIVIVLSGILYVVTMFIDIVAHASDFLLWNFQAVG